MINPHDHTTIWTINNSKEKKLLRSVLKPFDHSAYTQKEIDDLILHMRTMMITAQGVGLSANQIGINAQLFVAQLPSSNGRGYQGKFYAVFNPRIIKQSKKEITQEEGCLSIPNVYGPTPRAYKITIEGSDKRNRPITITAEGFLARIFQHEIDHLNGHLFIDKARSVEQIEL